MPFNAEPPGSQEPQPYIQPIVIIPRSIDVAPDRTTLSASIYADPSMPRKELASLLACHYGVSPEKVALNGLGGQPQQKSRKGHVVGFSNWGGCKWEPKGPQGDPSLN
jgi:hypothetical protein